MRNGTKLLKHVIVSIRDVTDLFDAQEQIREKEIHLTTSSWQLQPESELSKITG